jgi:hypothetical protein
MMFSLQPYCRTTAADWAPIFQFAMIEEYEPVCSLSRFNKSMFNLQMSNTQLFYSTIVLIH